MKLFYLEPAARYGRFVLALCLNSLVTISMAQQPARLSAEAIRQIEAIQAEKASRTPAQQKMDSQLVQAARSARGEAIAGAPKVRPALSVRGDGRVLVDIDATVSEALLTAIKTGGGQVVVSIPALKSIRALVSLPLAEALAGREEVRFIRPAVEATTNAGSVTSEGDIAHQANVVRARLNFAGTGNANGTGVRVGVLSDSVDFLFNSQASADLPAVTVLPGQSGVVTGSTGEGTAMLEIVHDLAPGAALFFATGSFGTANMAQNIRSLRIHYDCDIIIDDLTYFNESPFQDGVISQAVSEVCADGALYFSSARNSGNLNDGTSGTWEGDFLDAGDAVIGLGGRLHNFGAATFNTVTAVSTPSNCRVDLFWSDPLGGSGNDYDLYVLDASGTNVLRQSTNLQGGLVDPYESIAPTTSGSTTIPALNVGERIVIIRRSGAGRFLHLDTGRCQIALGTAGNVRGHNASSAANAFSVAATSAAGATAAFSGGAANPVRTFSSDGPRRMFFAPNGAPFTPGNFSSTGGIVLQKPDITAADRVMTSVPSMDATGAFRFQPFSGTSAAAPHAGAIAALLLSFNPDLTPAQIRTALQSSTLDIEAAGFDRDSGSGLVMTLPALDALLPNDVWVDFSLANDNGTGTFLNAFKTMRRAANNVRTGGTVHIFAPRSTPETITISRAMVLQAEGGAATIGQ